MATTQQDAKKEKREGGWTPLRTELVDHPKMLAIAELLIDEELDGLSLELRLAKATLARDRWFAWVDNHTTHAWNPGLTAAAIDLIVRCGGFARGMAAVGWITLRDDGVEITNYERFFGATRKRRMKEAKRKADGRSTDGRDNSTNGQTADKRRTTEPETDSEKVNPSSTPYQPRTQATEEDRSARTEPRRSPRIIPESAGFINDEADSMQQSSPIITERSVDESEGTKQKLVHSPETVLATFYRLRPPTIVGKGPWHPSANERALASQLIAAAADNMFDADELQQRIEQRLRKEEEGRDRSKCCRRFGGSANAMQAVVAELQSKRQYADDQRIRSLRLRSEAERAAADKLRRQPYVDRWHELSDEEKRPWIEHTFTDLVEKRRREQGDASANKLDRFLRTSGNQFHFEALNHYVLTMMAKEDQEAGL